MAASQLTDQTSVHSIKITPPDSRPIRRRIVFNRRGQSPCRAAGLGWLYLIIGRTFFSVEFLQMKLKKMHRRRIWCSDFSL
jgi:hypothetical protein